ncbi:VOC family protein [Agrobacterium rosae]|uniref:glyoxalase superfamily protein n=1 Tax=Agrobacterium rosae TaxID=1972867 RepID=UPI0019D34A1E|nr:glyoxalase superfamily protein [Agrobacterium rosae]MBN7805906.1 VOC family protein [Agrobacterium rosae]
MRDFLDAKAMARALKAALFEDEIDISHSRSLEIVARQFGFDNWNVLAAKIAASDEEPIRFTRVCPIIRIFDEAKAREFYVGFLGFSVDWEHRFGDNFPLYMQVSRAGLSLHLSGHHGDATPGSNVFVNISGVEAYQRELTVKDYTFMKPGVEKLPWGLQMQVTDPFSNRIRFCEQSEQP